MSLEQSQTLPTFLEVLDYARAIRAVFSRLVIPEPADRAAYTRNELERVNMDRLLHVYGARFSYQAADGGWTTLDATIVDGKVVGIAVQHPASAERLALSLKKASGRRHPNLNLSPPAFLSFPQHNLHFLAFETKERKGQRRYLHLHDGMSPKPRAKLRSETSMLSMLRKLEQRRSAS